ncbi:MAG: hypothetical protein ACI8QC_000465 [Planctomycetota bacterium]|jgi:hypothetical protein
MAYSRPPGLDARPSAGELTARMAGIGMKFAAEPEPNADIELTLVHAAEVGMDDGDLRVLSILTTWLGVHHRYVNVDRLLRAAKNHDSNRVKAYWSAIGSWLAPDRRFARLEKLRKRTRIHVLTSGSEFQLKRRGEDERFAGSALRVPAGVLRDRSQDVLSPTRLAEVHCGYSNRVQQGPSWRADVWTVLEAEPETSVSDAARIVRCSFAVAWEVVRDFTLLNPAGSGAAPIPS